MNKCFRKLSALVLTAGMMLSLTIGISAASSDYSVNVTADKEVQFILDNKVAASYDASKSDLTIKTGKSGLVVSFVNASHTTKNIGIGKQTSLALSGTMNSLTIDKSVTNTTSFSMTGSADYMTIDAPVKVSIGASADIATLKISKSATRVTAASGSVIKAVYAVDKNTISGAKKVYGLSAAPATNKTTTTEDVSNKQGSIATVLDIEYRDKDVMYTKELTIDGDFEISLESKPGIALGTAIRDLKMSVQRDDNGNTVAGKWSWVTGSFSTTTSGIYYYKFTPSLAQYAPMTVKINFTSNGNSRALDKPSIKFADGQRSHGAAGDAVTVTVSIPNQVQDDDDLMIYLNNDLITGSGSLLSESDAGETMDFTIDVGGATNDKCKIKARIKRAIGNGTVTSSTITYTID